MKTCSECGTRVNSAVLICPECGHTFPRESGTKLSLKQNTGGSNSHSLGMTINDGTSSVMMDDNFEAQDTGYYGSVNHKLFAELEEDEKEAAAYRKRRESKKVVSLLIRIAVIGALIYGVYFVLMTYVFVKKGADTYTDALNMYMEAINNEDASKMSEIVPPYFPDRKEEGQKWIDRIVGSKFTSISVSKRDRIPADEFTEMQDNIKMIYNKTLYITDSCRLTVEIKGSKKGINKGCFVKIDLIESEGKWYIFPDTYKNPMFEQ